MDGGLLKMSKLKPADKYLAVMIINSRGNLSKAMLGLFSAGNLKIKADFFNPKYELDPVLREGLSTW